MEPELHLESVGEMQVGESWRWGVMNKACAGQEMNLAQGKDEIGLRVRKSPHEEVVAMRVWWC